MLTAFRLSLNQLPRRIVFIQTNKNCNKKKIIVLLFVIIQKSIDKQRCKSKQ